MKANLRIHNFIDLDIDISKIMAMFKLKNLSFMAD